MNKALKIRIYPTSQQEQLLLQTFGCCRLVFNEHLQERNEFYIENILPLKAKKASQKEINRTYKQLKYLDLKQKYPFLKDVETCVLQQATRDCDTAFQNFFKSSKGQIKGERRGFPKFKSRKDNNQSYRTVQPSKKALNLTNSALKLPKIGEVKFANKCNHKWFRENKHKEIKSITVSKSASNRFYASILYEIPDKKVQLKDENQVIGLDFSPAELYVDSEGTSGLDYGYRAQKQAVKQKLTKLQRRFARKQMVKKVCEDGITRKVSSRNREKVRVKLARCEEQIANRRRDFIEKETLRLAQTYDKIVVEDLNLKGISKFLRNAKNMNDTSWATFISRLQQKGQDYGCNVVKADRWFPSSQLCNTCHYQKKDLKLSDRKWTCPKCGTNHIRDVNAAINLKHYVPKELRELRSVEVVESLASQALFNSEASLEQPKKQKLIAMRRKKKVPHL